jgi:tetratricopeptide (TPR) repeat protein/transcriptional regulator with XRE-family HTH domain
MLSEIGRQIRSLRRRAGLTQEELADRSALSERSLRDLESGRVTKPRAKSLRLIASALDLSVPETRQLLALLADEAPPRPVDQAPRIRLNQLPAADPHFTGRFTELRELDNLVSGQPARIITVSAIGGTGKTSLAIHWAHGAATHFPDGQIYVDLHGFTPGQAPADPAEALGQVLSALAVEPSDLPATLEERASLFRTLVADRQMLILLDNAATAEQVRPLLPGTPSCATIVTSRERLAGLIVRDGARPLLLDAMSSSEAGELLRKLLGADRVDNDRAAATEIIDLCGRLPLALRVVGAGIALGLHQTLPGAADDLAAADRLERLSFPDDPAASVLPAFQSSYDPLPTELKVLFGQLGLLPGDSFGKNAVASLMASNALDVDEQLNRLVMLNLVQSRGVDRFGLHDLVKLFALRCAGTDLAPLRRALDYYLQSADEANRRLRPSRIRASVAPPVEGVIIEAFDTSSSALEWCSEEVMNIVRAVDIAADHELYNFALQLPTSLMDFFQLRKHWSACLAMHNRALLVARSVGDKEREGILMCGIGLAYEGLGQYDKAQIHQQSAAAIARDGNHRLPLARAVSALAILAFSQGDLDAAVRHYSECAQIAAEDNDLYGGMLAAFNMGLAHLRAEDLDRATASFEKALPLSRQLDAADVMAGCIGALARIMQLNGDLEQALVRFRESATLAKATDNLMGLAETYGNIGFTLEQLGQITEAKEAFVLAVRTAEELGDLRLQADLQVELDRLVQAKSN